MNSIYSTKNRNNGKSTYHCKSTSNNSSPHFEQNNDRPQIKDIALFRMATTFGVKNNSRQRIKWFFYLHGPVDETTFRNNLERSCSRPGFVGKMFFEFKKDDRKNLLIIDTPLFLFSLDNVVQFSNNLLALAKQNPLFYDRWEISSPKRTFSWKIKNLFN